MKTKLSNIKNKIKVAGMTSAAVTPGLVVIANAADGTAKTLVQNLLGYIFGIFFFIGVLLLAWGIGQLVLAFKNEDGDSKSRAIMLIIASVVLMAVGGIVNGVLSGQDISASISKDF